jgi:hypothetical protein
MNVVQLSPHARALESLLVKSDSTVSIKHVEARGTFLTEYKNQIPSGSGVYIVSVEDRILPRALPLSNGPRVRQPLQWRTSLRSVGT